MGRRWTPSERAQQAALFKRWKPWQRSTGPKTPEGKATASRIPHPPTWTHNGGQLAFGPDGYLYIGTGDGAEQDDWWNNGQKLSVLLGKLLRVDVDGQDKGLAYRIPPSNPFRSIDGAAPEIWAYGFRNSWWFSFDRETGDLYIADVGDSSWEE